MSAGRAASVIALGGIHHRRIPRHARRTVHDVGCPRRPSSDPSVRSAVPRLGHEFPELGPRSIVLVVRTCREELRGSPADALPELVERLARQRLRVSLD